MLITGFGQSPCYVRTLTFRGNEKTVYDKDRAQFNKDKESRDTLIKQGKAEEAKTPEKPQEAKEPEEVLSERLGTAMASVARLGVQAVKGLQGR